MAAKAAILAIVILASYDPRHPDTSCQVSCQLAFRFRSSKEIFKMAAMTAILDSDRNDFSCFSSTSHPILPTKFRVNWPFGSREEVKNRF